MGKQALFQAVLFLSNVIQTITGFAGTMLAMPFSIRLVGIGEAKAVLNIYTILACLVIAVQNRRYICHKVLFRMTAGMMVGMAVGVWLFGRLPTEPLIRPYAVFVILIALKKMLVRKEIALPSWFMFFVVLAAGIVHGMFLSGGALLVIYASGILKEKKEFRATMAPVWVLLNAFLVLSHYRAGYYTGETLAAIVCSVFPLACSVFLGNILYRKMNRQQFLKLTYVLLLISGISLLI